MDLECPDRAEDVISDEENYETDETSTDDEDTTGRVALMIDPSQLSEGGDTMPQNGHDYLRLVQAERAKLPAVTCVKSPEKKLNCHDQIPKPTEKVGQYEDLAHRDDILLNFKNLRQKIESVRSDEPCPEYAENEQPSQKQLQDRVSRSEKQANNIMKLMALGHPPQVSDIVHLTQMELNTTLEKIALHCEMIQHYSELHTDWIYCLIAALREPIDSDICSNLRRIAKICIAKRKQLDNSEELYSCLLIICIVRNYFGQMDLR